MRSPKPAAEAARPTLEGLQKLPDPVGSNVPTNVETFAKVTAAVQIGGGVLLATGKVPRLASAALAATVIPANLGAHMFWAEEDPERKAQKRREFLTDLSLLGGLIIASADTAGKPSLGWRSRRAARKLGDTVSSALPAGSNTALIDSELVEKAGHRVQEGLHVGAERGRELAGVAAERSAPILEAARHRGFELAEVAQKRGAELADVAQKRGANFAELARDRSIELANATRAQSEDLAKLTRKQARKQAKASRKKAKELTGH